MRFIYFFLIITGGFGLIKYSKWVVDNTMRFETTEKFFGTGGTYTFWKLAGLLGICYGFYYLFNG